MAIAVLQFAEGVTVEMYDAVNAKLEANAGPPSGVLVHAAAPVEGGFRVFNVWESREAYERFREERLIPAIREVAGDEAVEGPPTAEVYELHDFVTG